MKNNTILASIETDRAIADILSNFSETYIRNVTAGSLSYKFRPYNTRMPNFPSVLEQKFTSTIEHAPDYKDQILETRESTYLDIIDSICEYYHLTISEEIPSENIYSVCYVMYQIFISEFTERMINFFVNYIITNMTSIIAAIPEERKTPKTSYAKKIYTRQEYIILYDNMDHVLNIVAGADIPFTALLEYLSDSQTASIISSYISDCGDIYKYFFASYLIDPITKTDVITTIKLKLVSVTAQEEMIQNPSNKYVY